MSKAFWGLLGVLVLGTAGFADMVYVDASSPYDPGSGTYAEPFLRIQEGLDAAGSGDTVVVRVGVYEGTGNRDLTPVTGGVTVTCEDPNDPAVIASTVIDPNGMGRAFMISSGGVSPFFVIGLTMRDGATSGSGGAIFCENNEMTLQDCRVEGSEAGLYGGGVYCRGGVVDMVRCVIRGNVAGDGGGVACEEGRVELLQSVLAGNHAIVHGGAIDGYGVGDVSLRNCTLAGNTADTGGCVCLRGSDMFVGNSIFWSNEANLADEMAALYLESSGTGSMVEIAYSSVGMGDPNISVDPGCTVELLEGVVNVDPLFASFVQGGDSAGWDLHLRSEAGRWGGVAVGWVKDGESSACLDLGDPADGVWQEPWPYGGRVNLGAYGGTLEASKSGNVADLNMDKRVDLGDLAILSLVWLGESPTGQNLAGDGRLDQRDFAVVLENWLWQAP